MTESVEVASVLSDAPEISYYGLGSEDFGILNFPKFVEAVKNNGYTLSGNKEDSVTAEEVVWLSVVDPETGSELPVIVDDEITEVIELEGFREVLRAMDDFLKESCGHRLFELPGVGEITEEDPEYDWEFDFELGGYVDPSMSPNDPKIASRKTAEPETFSEAFGMSALEYIKRHIL